MQHWSENVACAVGSILFGCAPERYPIKMLTGLGMMVRPGAFIWGSKMKMVKSLLLGSAAGLVAVAGAQAADLPVKAKPVEYVKICSLYGVGFYYIPGTDMCLKIGGWVRAEYGWGMNGSSTQTYGTNPY